MALTESVPDEAFDVVLIEFEVEEPDHPDGTVHV